MGLRRLLLLFRPDLVLEVSCDLGIGKGPDGNLRLGHRGQVDFGHGNGTVLVVLSELHLLSRLMVLCLSNGISDHSELLLGVLNFFGRLRLDGRSGYWLDILFIGSVDQAEGLGQCFVDFILTVDEGR